MTSIRKIAANRVNAARSTGPRSAQGKSSSSSNAFKHGLAARFPPNWGRSEQLERLAKSIVGETKNPHGQELAHQAAEAEFELRRIRAYRSSLIDLANATVKLDSANEDLSLEGSELTLTQATAIIRTIDDIATVDRYERRALSRRNRLFRELAKLNFTAQEDMART